MSATFAEIRKAAPTIHVPKPKSKHDKGGVMVLEPQDGDARYDDEPYSKGYTKGRGTRNDPCMYKSAADVSPHYAIVDLWYRFRNRKRPVFIDVNGWLLKVGPEGVTASDGTFTKLI